MICLLGAIITAECPAISIPLLALVGLIEYKLGFFNDSSHAEGRDN